MVWSWASTIPGEGRYFPFYPRPGLPSILAIHQTFTNCPWLKWLRWRGFHKKTKWSHNWEELDQNCNRIANGESHSTPFIAASSNRQRPGEFCFSSLSLNVTFVEYQFSSWSRTFSRPPGSYVVLRTAKRLVQRLPSRKAAWFVTSARRTSNIFKDMQLLKVITGFAKPTLPMNQMVRPIRFTCWKTFQRAF
jgi:hypothetical protein